MSYLKDKLKYQKRIAIKKAVVKHTYEIQTFANMDLVKLVSVSRNLIKKGIDLKTIYKDIKFICGNDIALSLKVIQTLKNDYTSKKHMDAFFKANPNYPTE